MRPLTGVHMCAPAWWRMRHQVQREIEYAHGA